MTEDAWMVARLREGMRGRFHVQPTRKELERLLDLASHPLASERRRNESIAEQAQVFGILQKNTSLRAALSASASEVAELREALAPWAEYGERIATDNVSRHYPDTCPVTINPQAAIHGRPNVGDLRRARAALRAKEGGVEVSEPIDAEQEITRDLTAGLIPKLALRENIPIRLIYRMLVWLLEELDRRDADLRAVLTIAARIKINSGAKSHDP